MKNLYSTLICALMALNSIGATITAIRNGNWTNSSTWDLNRTPSHNDIVLIPTGITVYFQNAPYPKNDASARPTLDIRIQGTLDFSNAGNDKLYLGLNSTVQIYSGGKIATVMPGNEIIAIYNGSSDNTVWTGSPITIDGPKSATGTSLGFLNSLLPLKFLSFDVSRLGKTLVQLRWRTTDEVNTSYFEVQHMKEGSAMWMPVGTIKAAGNSSQILTYLFNSMVSEGLNQYRLKQVDHDGQFTYSPIRFFELMENHSTLTFVRNSRMLSISNATSATTCVLISDLAGRVVWKKMLHDHSMQIFVPHSLRGVHLVTLVHEHGSPLCTKVQF